METKNKISIALGQIDITWENPSRNVEKLEKLLNRTYEKFDIMVLPEMFTTGFSLKARELAEPMDGPSVTWMKRLAEKTNAAICGTLIIKENDNYYNRFVFIKPGGEIAHYDKRHLFSPGGEKNAYTPGAQRTIINYLGWRIGLYICYDLRFPVWCRNRNDTDLMLFPANWPLTRNLAWNTLLKARAIENQAYVAGINRIGIDGNGVKYFGESQVINPAGNIVLKPTFQAEGFLTGQFSLSELHDIRKKFPVENDADLFEIL